jgi:chromosome segregation and condensation protein ScpB
MTAKEMQKIKRLEIENSELRAQIEKHMSVYRESLYQIVEMKTKLQLIDMAMHGGDDAG